MKEAVGEFFIRKYLGLKGMAYVPYHRKTFRTKSTQKVELKKNIEEVYYQYINPGEDLLDHLEFHLKNEGLNLEVACLVFKEVGHSEVKNYVTAKLTGKYQRIIWYLYESLTGKKLDIPDLDRTKYVKILNDKKFVTTKGELNKRYYVNDNLLGPLDFSPLVRRTSKIDEWLGKNFKKMGEEIVSEHDAETIYKAINYLYTKETKSSFEIERETPSEQKIIRFVGLLRAAKDQSFINDEHLLELQNSIVEPPKQEESYRNIQNYVSENVGYSQKFHYICPKPEDVKDLMSGLLSCYRKMQKGDVNPIIIAAVVSFSFVYIHPFEDGNGRIHRFLIHQILSTFNVTPSELIFPISATMLENSKQYDEALENFSSKIIPLIKYSLDAKGRMTVLSETDSFYRYIDLTFQSDYLFSCLEQTISESFSFELDFIASFDEIKELVLRETNLSDKNSELLIKLISGNKGKLSPKKRRRLFKTIEDTQLKKIESFISDCLFDSE